MSGMQGVRRDGPEPLPTERSSDERVFDSGSVVVVGDGGRGDQDDSSPQQRAALRNLAYAYGSLLSASNPEYDWIIEIR